LAGACQARRDGGSRRPGCPRFPSGYIPVPLLASASRDGYPCSGHRLGGSGPRLETAIFVLNRRTMHQYQEALFSIKELKTDSKRPGPGTPRLTSFQISVPSSSAASRPDVDGSGWCPGPDRHRWP